MKNRQLGLGAIAAIMVLVIMASMAAAITQFSTGQQLGSAMDLQSTRALLAASAGTEWGLAQAFRHNSCLPKQSWTHPDYSGLKVTIRCTAKNYDDGEMEDPSSPSGFSARVIRVFEIEANACNSNDTDCPDDDKVSHPGYVERERVAIAYCEWNGTSCTPL